MKKIVVTAALPYANGPIHIGHLVEYIQTDIFVRFLKLIGEKAIYICADDAHGTPIEINAKKQGKTPEQFIKKWLKEHQEDFKNVLIEFDNYHTTNSKENKYYSDYIFNKIKEKGHLYEKEVELNYCEKCKRFLPDRYIKGKCPKCNAEEQYGDVCEQCHATYSTIDLVESYCVICKSKPIRKKSEHYFFKLSALSEKLRKWLTENKKLQKEVVNHVISWIDEGLEDWDITRDAPYFGFNIPGEKDKYYYVWLDAPIGYISSTKDYCNKKKENINDYWKKGRIIHFIGKDIIYFHFLFWPAMLMDAEFSLPERLVVHGFLTVNKEKMSKSRGTFFTAKEFLKKYNPEFLRYYYASNLTYKMQDLDLSFEDFTDKINNELIANVGNFFYRVLHFCKKNFNGKITKEIDKLDVNYDNVTNNYNDVNFREAVKHILEISSKGNKYFQDNEPWKLIKNDKQGTQKIVNTCFNLIKDLTILLKPILPRFTQEVEKQINLKLTFKDLGKQVKTHKIKDAKIIFHKIEKVEEKEESLFSKLNIKVAKVLEVKDVPKADKLYEMKIDLGTEKRTIVGGLKSYYSKKELIGKHICVLTNLEKAKFKGIESRGMLLAANGKEKPELLLASKSSPGDQVYIEGITPLTKEINYKTFSKIKMKTKDKKVVYDNKTLKTSKENIECNVEDGVLVS